MFGSESIFVLVVAWPCGPAFFDPLSMAIVCLLIRDLWVKMGRKFCIWASFVICSILFSNSGDRVLGPKSSANVNIGGTDMVGEISLERCMFSKILVCGLWPTLWCTNTIFLCEKSIMQPTTSFSCHSHPVVLCSRLVSPIQTRELLRPIQAASSPGPGASPQ